MMHITYIATPGLANRLRALAGYYALAQVQGIDLHVHWIVNRACDTPFTDLFEPLEMEGIRFIHVEETSRKEDPEAKAIFTISPYFARIWVDHGHAFCEENPFLAIALRVLRSLTPRKHLREQLDTISSDLDIGACIGVHIRMTDNLNNYAAWMAGGFDPQKASRLQGFRDYLTTLDSEGKRTFLATDNKDIESELTTRFATVVSAPKNYDMASFEGHARRESFTGRVGLFSRMTARLYKTAGLHHAHLGWLPTVKDKMRTTPIEDAVIDLFLLSRCKSVVGTYWSSFGPVAALIGRRECSMMLGVQLQPHQKIQQWNKL